MKANRKLPEWANLLLKALLIMVFPLYYYGDNLYEFFNLPPTGLLFTPLVNYLVRDMSFALVTSSLGTYIRNFILGILIAFTGMYYNHKLSQVPLNRSYWKRGLGTAVAVYALLYGLSLLVSFGVLFQTGPYDYNLYLIIDRLSNFGTLVIGVFIILPLVQRQAVIIGSPASYHDESLREIESNPGFNLTREKILAAVLWFSLCFGPILVASQSYGWYTNIASLLVVFSVSANNLLDLTNIYISYSVSYYTILPLFALMALFHFVFVRDVYRYIRKTITRQKLISMALLGIIFPYIIASLLGAPIFWYQVFMLIPIPVLQVVGFLVVRFHRPHIDQGAHIWKDARSKMRWEKEEREKVIFITPEKPIRIRDETITIPISYLVESRIRLLTRRLRR